MRTIREWPYVRFRIKRAIAVVSVLVETYGIDAERLSAIGFGEEQLLSQETTNEAHQLNRRVVATVQELGPIDTKP